MVNYLKSIERTVKNMDNINELVLLNTLFKTFLNNLHGNEEDRHYDKIIEIEKIIKSKQKYFLKNMKRE